MIQAGNRTADITFDGATVTITRHRSALGVMAGTRIIPLAHITAVRWKPAGRFAGAGYLGLLIAGSPEHHYRTTQVLQTDLLKDPNAIPFGYGQMPAFEEVKKAIEQALAQPTAPAAVQPAVDAADQLAKLAELHQRGILTDEEFSKMKAKLIG